MTDKPTLQMIRLYCDGELSPEQEAELRRCLEEHPECRASFNKQLECERKLRDCLRDYMTSECECAPKSLCECVRAACGCSGAAKSAKQSDWTLSSLFRGPMRANVFAVAATLALVAGAVLFGIFGRSIDDVPRRISGADLVAQAAISASGHHDESTSGKAITPEQTRALAGTELTNYLKVESPVHVFDFDELGYRFIGSDHCDMRLPERSAHLLYKSNTPKAAGRYPMVSVFIVPNRGDCCAMCNGGRWSSAEGLANCRHKVMYSNDRQLIYFLVCCNENDLESLSQRMTATMSAK